MTVPQTLSTPSPEKLSVQAYLRLEAASEAKHEFIDGRLRTMGGGTLNHSIVGNNVCAALTRLVDEHALDCTPFNSEARIWIESLRAYHYPDAMLVCGYLETALEDPLAVVNPLVVVEVLSPSTEAYDRGEKFYRYRQLASLRDYLLLDAHRPYAEVFSRSSADQADPPRWTLTPVEGLQAEVVLPSLGRAVPMAAFYRRAIGLATE
jgi:Uma2 family endonuclease